jgi:mono/diheme cytochrome c family protein
MKIKRIKSLRAIVFVALGALYMFVSACGSDPNSPGIEYMPDMYRSPSYETNSSNGIFADSSTQRMPVAGTVARGFMPETYGADTSGYSGAKKYLKNAVPYNEDAVSKGEILYGKYCTHCHGATGAGDGLVGLKLPGPPPPYSAPDKMAMSEGEIYHLITYGKGLMGPHGTILTQKERWMLVHYVQRLQGKTKPDGTLAMSNDSVPAAAATATVEENSAKAKETDKSENKTTTEEGKKNDKKH